MKRFTSFLSTFLLLVGAACVFIALILGSGYALQHIQSEQTIESLRPDGASGESEAPSAATEETSSKNEESVSESKDSSSSETEENVSESDEASSSETEENSSGSDEASSSETEDAASESDEASSSETEENSSGSDEASSSQTEESASDIAAIPNPYAESFLKNEDMAAWLVIPGTNIDYPVMWTPEDENYYLYKDFNGKENVNGCLILDTDSCLDPLTTNQIIHGHNMKSGAMFGNLTDYEDQNYYKEHKQITLYTESCQRNYEIIAVFRSQVYKKTDTVFKFYKFFQADTEEEFNDFYRNIKDLSIYDTGVTAEFGDNFITLSTCVYHVENGRFVVVAKEIEQGDTYLPLE